MVMDGFDHQVCGGYGFSCGLDATGTPVCAGDDIITNSIPANLQFRFLACGRFHVCGLMNNGSVNCWGASSMGQLNIPANYTYAFL